MVLGVHLDNMYVRLAQLISRINLAKAQRIDSFKIVNSKINFAVLFKLEELGILRGFQVEDEHLFVFMKYIKKRVPFTRMWLVGKSSRRGYINLEKLHQLVDRNGSSIFVLSTGRGLLSHSECFALRCSGEIIIRIDL